MGINGPSILVAGNYYPGNTYFDRRMEIVPKNTVAYFLLDQLLHLLVIAACWYFIFLKWEDVRDAWQQLNANTSAWKMITAFVFLTTPSGILIGQLTRQWREKIVGAEGLANAGKWIGIKERIIILIVVLHNQFSAIGLLVAAKGYHPV